MKRKIIYIILSILIIAGLATWIIINKTNTNDQTDKFFPVCVNGKWGFIDTIGNTVIPCKYEDAGEFSEGLANVKLNGKYGFIDETGKEIIPYKYEDAGVFSEGLGNVKLNEYGFIDKTGKEIIPFKYEDAGCFSEGLGNVKLNGKWGFIDKTGKEIIPYKYDYVRDFSEGLARVYLLNGNKWFFIDKTGKEIMPHKYDDDVYVYDFIEGLVRVELNGKYGYIDKTGKEIIPCKYDFAGDFIGGLAKVKLYGEWGFIDKTGKEIIPCKYDNAWNFSIGFACVELNNGDLYFIHPAFSLYVEAYVDKKIIEWEKKGEFEKTTEWQTRINDSTRKIMANRLFREAKQIYITKGAEKDIILSLNDYDADNEVFPISTTNILDEQNIWKLHVPANRAQYFKESWNSMEYSPKYVIENDRLTIAEMKFILPNGEKYTYCK